MTLFDNIAPEPNTGCWLWLGGVSGSGYGITAIKRKSTSVHRLAYTLAKGPIPAGKFVCHKCDVRTCINPDHLFLGTAAENTRDMINKGRRISPGTENRMRGVAWVSAHHASLPRGESHLRAKITEEDVADIRRSIRSGVSLAKQYGLTPTSITRIRKRLSWKHVGD